KDIITGRYINPIKGRGVFAKTPILQGSFILEYRGTLVEKGKLGKINNNNYAYFFKHGGRDCCIDASLDDGSLGRLVNDSQKPNGKIKKIDLGGKPHLCLFAIKDINKDDEITYNYGGQDLPWCSYCGQELCKFVHEPVAPAITGSEVTSAKEDFFRHKMDFNGFLKKLNFFSTEERKTWISWVALGQDLAPAHTAKSTKSWLNDHGVGVLDWPANSPDLNPIENLWSIVKRKMRNKRPKHADELKATVKETWASIPPQQCHKLITSIPRRIEAVIKAKGAPTKY
uniref:SET domain-containing protein n=1 Tax=Cyprinus carpio carpio TaxID=630221 RepID=A0A9J7XV86_CYPCA